MKWIVAAALLAASCGGSTVPSGQGQGTLTGEAAGEPSGAPADRSDDAAAEAERTAVIEKAMNDLAPAANGCWGVAAADDYRLEGRVSVLIDVGADRTAVTVREDTTRDPVLVDCLKRVIEGYAWPAPMRGHATVLPFAFRAPNGQNMIDRRYVPAVETGARVILDAKNSGNGAATMFEAIVGAGAATTASARAELWIDLGSRDLDAVYLPPRTARTPAAGRYLIVAVPGGQEDGTRRAGVLPAEPAGKKEKGRPAAVPAGVKQAQVLPRKGVGTVSLRLDPTKVKGAALSAAVIDIDAGAVVPKHVHDASTELLYVLAGGGTMVVDGVELTVTEHSVVQVPAGVEHSFTATAATRALQFYAPPGPEQRFKQK